MLVENVHVRCISLAKLLDDDRPTVRSGHKITVSFVQQNITDTVFITIITATFSDLFDTEFRLSLQIVEIDALFGPKENDLILDAHLDSLDPRLDHFPILVRLPAELLLRPKPGVEGCALRVKNCRLLWLVLREHPEREHEAAIDAAGDQLVPVERAILAMLPFLLAWDEYHAVDLTDLQLHPADQD